MRRAEDRQGKARAPGTMANQRSSTSTYIAFARRAAFPPLLPSHHMICAFIEYLATYISAPGTIRNNISHVRGYIWLAGAPMNEIDHPRVTRALEALERDKSYTPNKKLPVPTELIRSVIISIPKTPVGLAVRAAVLIMFYGALRQSEVATASVKKYNQYRHPTRSDVVITPRQITMKVKWAKNMQKASQSRNIVMQAVQDKDLCPVATLQAHFALTPSASSIVPLLKYPLSGDPIPLSVIKATWEAALTVQGADTKLYSLHSLRKAAATEADREGCQELLIQRLGGWKSTAYKQYIHHHTDYRANNALIKSISKA